MIKLKNVSSFLLCACTYIGWGCSALLFQAQETQAKLIVGFQFADGSTNQIVPTTGGTFTVNIVASTDNPATTNLGVNAGYIGALSQILNGSTIDGDITASAIVGSPGTGLQGTGFNHGLLSDVNTDGRVDLGFANGIPKSTSGWMRPTTGGIAAVLLGGPTGVIGSFTVTIPANSANNGLSFLSYAPQLDPGGVANDWSWTESNAQSPLLGGSVFQGGVGVGNVLNGSSVTFTAVPEPATWSLLGVTIGAGLFWRRPT